MDFQANLWLEEAELAVLLSYQFDNGNFPASLPLERDRLVQVCHGAPGVVVSLLSIREYFPSLKEKIDKVKNYQAKSTVVSPTIGNVDVFSIVSDETAGYINFLRVNNGAIIQSHTLELKKKLDETDDELLEDAIVELFDRFGSPSPEIILPWDLKFEIPNKRITIPQIGDKKRLLELSERNAKYYRLEQLKQIKIIDPDRHTKRIMAQMQKDLRMPVEPRHIEGFDNSNIQKKSH